MSAAVAEQRGPARRICGGATRSFVTLRTGRPERRRRRDRGDASIEERLQETPILIFHRVELEDGASRARPHRSTDEPGDARVAIFGAPT
jgi:hypothetical protein